MNLNVTILGQTIAFILFVWFCMKYVWLPIIFIIEKRRKKISDSLKEIKLSEIESQKKYNKASDHLNKARLQAQEIINHAYLCKTKILNEARYEALQERNEILSQTKDQINQEKKRVSNELKNNISELIIQSTEKIIEQSINKTVDANIISNILKTLSKQNNKDQAIHD